MRVRYFHWKSFGFDPLKMISRVLRHVQLRIHHQHLVVPLSVRRCNCPAHDCPTRRAARPIVVRVAMHTTHLTERCESLNLSSEQFLLTHTRARRVWLLFQTPVPDDGHLPFYPNGAANVHSQRGWESCQLSGFYPAGWPEGRNHVLGRTTVRVDGVLWVVLASGIRAAS